MTVEAVNYADGFALHNPEMLDLTVSSGSNLSGFNLNPSSQMMVHI
jgi:hypothetical protein